MPTTGRFCRTGEFTAQSFPDLSNLQTGIAKLQSRRHPDQSVARHSSGSLAKGVAVGGEKGQRFAASSKPRSAIASSGSSGASEKTLRFHTAPNESGQLEYPLRLNAGNGPRNLPRRPSGFPNGCSCGGQPGSATAARRSSTRSDTGNTRCRTRIAFRRDESAVACRDQPAANGRAHYLQDARVWRCCRPRHTRVDTGACEAYRRKTTTP